MASLRMSSKLLLSRKNGKPRTGSCRPSEGVACAINWMEALCADTRGASAAVSPRSHTTAQTVFFMPLIVADASGLRCEWVQMVNGAAERRAESVERIAFQGSVSWRQGTSVELEGNFDDLAYGRWLSVRTQRRFQTPGAHRLNGLLVQAESQALGDVHVGHASIRCDHGDELDDALHLYLHGFVAVIRARAIETRRHPIAAGPTVWYPPAGAISLARSDAVAIAVADAVAVTVPHRSVQPGGKRIAPVLVVVVGQLDIGVAEHCGRHGDIRFRRIHHRPGNLHPRKLRRLAFGCRSVVGLSAATARPLRRGRKFGDIG